mgnify:CR=1 FL=1|tara:strand:+ start:861 stop:1511 length:651 start_codon:yes stop_codon:yes gene_type:complete
MKNKHALILGATGATGQELVKLLLENPIYDKVTIFVRREVEIFHKKLNIHIINFSKLNEYKDLINGDVLFSALGTTLKDAGSKEKQYIVDYTYQFEFAKIASENRINTYSLVSSLGANVNSLFFYTKIKGKLEKNINQLDFKTIQIFQPPSLIRQPELMRSVEKISVKLFQKISNFGILRSFKPISVEVLASKMLNESLKPQINRCTIYKPSDIAN